MKNVLNIVGARPQFVKAALVSKALRQQCQEIFLHTGQHYDDNMSKIFFEELEIPEPQINLGIGSGSHAEQTAGILVGIEKVLLENKIDWVLVYGDTNSTLAGALAAAKLHVPVAHVEAGLRSYNRQMPEEINRVLCDHISDLLFCPTAAAAQTLAGEGISQGVHVVGDVMYDALLAFLPIAQKRSSILATFKEQFPVCSFDPGSYALVTIHRAANTDDPARLKSILSALGQLGIPVVFPVHPRTRKVIDTLGITLPATLLICEPTGYLDTLMLQTHAQCILTDSGGMQKEAYWLGVRCITLREETEWGETLSTGWNMLAGAGEEQIVNLFHKPIPTAERPPIYGDGHAAEIIAQIFNP